ncbi:hypothetical protein RF11_00670 [Thelohanellus kitauei]|uniref:Uncharacterized protein n=1 Tax=Thelohanellus kitauei TaxID=669202 RepID=A0A0C2J209_THEKT|nr:hypothetical protein RF11_00670 [Thelohanellus kitauei]
MQNYVNPTNIIKNIGVIPQERYHQSYRLHIGYERNKYTIILFRPRVCCDITSKATDFTYDQSYTLIEEAVEFEEQIFGNKVYEPRRDSCAKAGSLNIKHYRCMYEGCRRVFKLKIRLKV